MTTRSQGSRGQSDSQPARPQPLAKRHPLLVAKRHFPSGPGSPGMLEPHCRLAAFTRTQDGGETRLEHPTGPALTAQPPAAGSGIWSLSWKHVGNKADGPPQGCPPWALTPHLPTSFPQAPWSPRNTRMSTKCKARGSHHLRPPQALAPNRGFQVRQSPCLSSLTLKNGISFFVFPWGRDLGLP